MNKTILQTDDLVITQFKDGRYFSWTKQSGWYLSNSEGVWVGDA